MKKIEKLDKTVFEFLEFIYKEENPDMGFTPAELIEYEDLCEYSEAQVYGSCRRLLEKDLIKFYKEGRIKKYQYKSTEPIPEPEPTVFTVPNDPERETVIEEDLISYSKDYFIQLLGLTPGAVKFVREHGMYFNVAMKQGDMFLVESLFLTEHTGPGGENASIMIDWIHGVTTKKEAREILKKNRFAKLFAYRKATKSEVIKYTKETEKEHGFTRVIYDNV
jgi:hypothetical protein